LRNPACLFQRTGRGTTTGGAAGRDGAGEGVHNCAHAAARTAGITNASEGRIGRASAATASQEVIPRPVRRIRHRYVIVDSGSRSTKGRKSNGDRYRAPRSIRIPHAYGILGRRFSPSLSLSLSSRCREGPSRDALSTNYSDEMKAAWLSPFGSCLGSWPSPAAERR